MTVLLVRHADREGTADALSSVGLTRAQELVHVMEKFGIGAIYNSEAARTQHTGEPTATALGIDPVMVAAADVKLVVDKFRAHHTGGKGLVIGHSNSIPQIIAEFGGPALSISENEYDNLYVVTVCRCRWHTVALTNLQYGDALSP